MKTLLILFSSLIAFIFTFSFVEAAGLPGWSSILVTGLTMLAGTQIPKGSVAITCGAITMGADLNCNFPVTAGTNDTLYLLNFNEIAGVTRDSNNPLIVTGITMNSYAVTDNTITITVTTNSFATSDVLTGATSGATGTISSIVSNSGSTAVFILTGITGSFQVGETIHDTTNSSGAGTIVGEPATAYVFNGQLGSLKPKWSVVKQTYTRPYDHEIDFLVFDATATQKQNLAQLALGRVVAVVVQNYVGDSTSSAKIEIYGLDTGMIVDAMLRDLSKVDTQSAIEITLKTADNVKEPRPAANYFHTDATTSLSDINALVAG